MNPDPEKYLLPLDDGLPKRVSQTYAIDKLYALEAYLRIAQRAMKNKSWSGCNYIDLQAGPGKNLINNEVFLGSPLIALDVVPPFSQYWFNELGDEEFGALSTRVHNSKLSSRINLLQYDVNFAVNFVVDKINEMDVIARSENKWSTFNIAFLDPQGLEVEWTTIEKLASVNRMDLIINFSTSGINRTLHQRDRTDAVFGNKNWRNVANSGDPTIRRRQLINLYREQLEQFGYHIVNNDDLGYHDISMKNSKNAEVYSLIFAGKHPLADKFWRQVKTEIERLRHRGSLLL